MPPLWGHYLIMIHKPIINKSIKKLAIYFKGKIIMDKNIFNLINRHSGRHQFIDIIMILVSKRIRYVYLIVLIFLWFKDPSTKKVAKKAIITAIFSWIIRMVTNIFYFKPRPFVSNRVGILIPSKTDSTYLSKHSILTFSISFSILLYHRLLGSILMVLSILTGFSRVWVGHHYPSDIFRSAFISVLLSLIVEKTFPYKRYIYEKLCIPLKTWIYNKATHI
jgi:undecaprenyl-diphosphatase